MRNVMLEKSGKDRLLIRNWRPISLLNLDYKIAAKSIATRITKVLSKLIHHNQSEFIKGRYTGESIRLIEDVMEFTKRKNIEGLLISVDFEKAFDSLEICYLLKVLQIFNFGPNLIHWVKTFYNNITSCVMNNGLSSGYFRVERGVRQGDPLSPYLFLLGIELFAENNRQDYLIRGLMINEVTEIKLVQYYKKLKLKLIENV